MGHFDYVTILDRHVAASSDKREGWQLQQECPDSLTYTVPRNT